MSFILTLICLTACGLVAWSQCRQEKKIAEIITANNAMDDDLCRAESILARLDSDFRAAKVISFADPDDDELKAA